MIPVTKTFFPPITELYEYIARIYKNGWLTNRGELIVELEEKLKKYLNIEQILITTNGTLPLQMALKSLDVTQGEIITTPFSYVATTAAIVWEGFKPVFVDINPQTLNIDETLIEMAITKKTRAILATHVFGNPCNVFEIERIAKRHKLKVIYDAAHCFGVKFCGKSIFNYGDISTCSFHATKIFHTGEGGAVFTGDKEIFHRLFYSHNFGHNGPMNFHGLGINGKTSELQAAMGLAVLNHVNDIIYQRKKIIEKYKTQIDSTKYFTVEIGNQTEWNYSYFPLIFKDENELILKQEKLNKEGIFPRRYFYPSLNTLPYVSYTAMPVSESIAKRIICLPVFLGLEEKVILKITNILNE
jgi:dTDP-4-amino-4,6-dideoxygalactose transaminase